MTAAGFGLAAWGWFAPAPYLPCILVLALTPPAALAFIATPGGRAHWRLFDVKGDPAPSVTMPWFIGSVMTAVRALLDINILDWQGPFLAATVLGLACGWVVHRLVSSEATTPRYPRRALVLGVVSAFLGLGWGWGVVAQLDARLDRAPASPVRTRILGAGVFRGRSVIYSLDLAPWGGPDENGPVDVPRSLFDQVRKGGLVCVTPHPGALRFRWYEVALCGPPVARLRS